MDVDHHGQAARVLWGVDIQVETVLHTRDLVVRKLQGRRGGLGAGARIAPGVGRFGWLPAQLALRGLAVGHAVPDVDAAIRDAGHGTIRRLRRRRIGRALRAGVRPRPIRWPRAAGAAGKQQARQCRGTHEPPAGHVRMKRQVAHHGPLPHHVCVAHTDC